MQLLELSMLLLSFLISAALTGWLRVRAIRGGRLDVPNHRSSHTIPTPRGGGLAIVAVTLLITVVLFASGLLSARLTLAMLIGGSAIAVVGYIDDLQGVNAGIRFAVHLLASTFAVVVMQTEASWNMGSLLLGAAFALAIAGSVNVYNFMDGIDGLAAGQFVLVCTGAALLSFMGSGPSGFTTLLACASAASLGFLYWNWAPARIFMGDVGSGFIGYFVGLAAIAAHLDTSLSVWTWTVLTSVFIADAGATLLSRVYARRKWWEAHRSHAYQRLSRRHGHRPVTMGVLLLNLAIAWPLSYLTHTDPDHAMGIALTLVVVLTLICWTLGAGQDEVRNDASASSADADATRVGIT